MDNRKLRKILDTIILLKGILKCPICLDVIQEGVELECGHRYCKECFDKHKATRKQASCPLCKKAFSRRSTFYKDEYADTLGNFVYECCENARNVYNCEVEQLQKRLEEELNVVAVTEVLQHNDDNFAIPSTSKDTRFHQEKLPTPHSEEKKGRKYTKKGKAKQIENNQSAFDKLVTAQSPMQFNKKETKRVYVNKKKVQTKLETKPHVLEFDDHENKVRVLQWLNDTRNKFDRLSQTQNIVSDGLTEVSHNDLVSISQLKKNKGDFKPVSSKTYRGRAKSLDVEIKKTERSGARCRSLAKSMSFDNYNIEDINTEEEVVKKAEEKVILDLIEDRFLDKLESELESSKDEFDVKSKVRRFKKNKLPSPTSTTGWERLTKIEKTINRSKKGPKQLKVTLESTQELNTSKTTSKSVKHKNNCDTSVSDPTVKVLKVILIKDNTDNKSSNIANEEISIGNKSRPPEIEDCPIEVIDVEEMTPKTRVGKQTYDLKKVEDYITKNMEMINKTVSTDLEESNVEKQPKNFENPVNDDANYNEESEEIEHEQGDENLNTEKQTKIDEINDSHCLLLDVLFNTPTQKTCRTPPKDEVVVIDDDVVPVVPSNSATDNTARKMEDCKRRESVDDILKMYSCATQQVTHTCEEKQDFTGETCDSVDDLLQLFEAKLALCLANLKSTDTMIENQLRNLQFHVLKSKSMLKKNDDIVEEKTTLKDLCNVETQTIVETTHKTVQTEVSSNDIGIQTENLFCIKCKLDLNENKVPNSGPLISQNTKTALESMLEEPMIDFKPTLHSTCADESTLRPQNENDIFTCTLDNLNFETQDVAMNRGVIKSVAKKIDSQKVTQSKEKTIENKEIPRPTLSKAYDNKTDEDISGQVLLCTLNSTNKSKGVNRKLLYDGDRSTRFKRIRKPASDSDSEEEVPSKRKRQRFPQDDLTLEILSNPEQGDLAGNKNSTLESQYSDGVYYEEYLAEVMKKYEDDTPPLKKSTSPKPKKTDRREEITSNFKETAKALKTVSNISAISCDSYKTASDSDKIFMNEDNLMKLERDICEYEKNKVAVQNSEFSDIIGASEQVDPSPKKFKKTVIQTNKEILLTKKRKLPESEQDFDVLNNGFNADELEVLPLNQEAKIKILSNLKIRSQDNKLKMNVDDDDLFSDEDIVETTPQKNIHNFTKRSSSPRTPPNFFNDLPDPLTETDNFEFGSIALPPPPDFQDDIDIPPTPEKEELKNIPPENDVIIPNVDESLTPDRLSQFMLRNHRNYGTSQVLSPCIMPFTRGQDRTDKNDTSKVAIRDPEKFDENNSLTTPNKQRTSKNMSHNTPVCRVDLTKTSQGCSPMSTGNSGQKMGITEMVESSRHTPLISILKPFSQRQNLLTSTPGQKSILNYVKTSQTSKDESPMLVMSKPCVCHTRLTEAQDSLVKLLANKNLVTYSPRFGPNVTHLIVLANEKNCLIEYTMKFVSAVAAGVWVLRFEWVDECLRRDCIIPEEPYEVLDISGIPGPKISRLTGKWNPLFRGYKFVCVEPSSSITRKDIENILRMLGGTVLRRLKDLEEDDGKIGIIIAEGQGTQDFDQYDRWLESYKTVTVDIEWLCGCVGQFKILSLRPFVLCSEDSCLGDLGYPQVLTETVPYSCTETF